MLARRLLFFCDHEEDDTHRDTLSLELSGLLRDFNVNIERAIQLILNGANPNTQSVTNHSILQVAAATCPEWIPLLLYLGADPNRLDANQRDAFSNCFNAHTNDYLKAEALLAIIQYNAGITKPTKQVFHNWLLSRFPIVTTTLQAFNLGHKKWRNANYVYAKINPMTLRLAIYYDALRHSQRLELVRKLMVLLLQDASYRVPKELLISIFHLAAQGWFTQREVVQLVNFIVENKAKIRAYLRSFSGIQWFYSKLADDPFALEPPYAKWLYEYQMMKKTKGNAAAEIMSKDSQFRYFRESNSVSLFKSPLNQLAFKERWQQSEWIKTQYEKCEKLGIP